MVYTMVYHGLPPCHWPENSGIGWCLLVCSIWKPPTWPRNDKNTKNAVLNRFNALLGFLHHYLACVLAEKNTKPSRSSWLLEKPQVVAACVWIILNLTKLQSFATSSPFWTFSTPCWTFSFSATLWDTSWTVGRCRTLQDLITSDIHIPIARGSPLSSHSPFGLTSTSALCNAFTSSLTIESPVLFCHQKSSVKSWWSWWPRK